MNESRYKKILLYPPAILGAFFLSGSIMLSPEESPKFPLSLDASVAREAEAITVSDIITPPKAHAQVSPMVLHIEEKIETKPIFQSVTEARVAIKSGVVPSRISIPAIGVDAPVVGFGIDEEGKMMVPDNYIEVGWYKDGVKPGESGSAVLGAHVDNGSLIEGVFKHLKNLKVGDDITVTDKTGSVRVFRIVTTKVYDYRYSDTRDIFTESGPARLNLITCHGTWLPRENTYDKRLVVFAELID